MSYFTIILCVAVGIALSELVLLGLLIGFHSLKDRWDYRQWRKDLKPPSLADVDMKPSVRCYHISQNIIWHDRPMRAEKQA